MRKSVITLALLVCFLTWKVDAAVQIANDLNNTFGSQQDSNRIVDESSASAYAVSGERNPYEKDRFIADPSSSRLERADFEKSPDISPAEEKGYSVKNGSSRNGGTGPEPYAVTGTGWKENRQMSEEYFRNPDASLYREEAQGEPNQGHCKFEQSRAESNSNDYIKKPQEQTPLAQYEKGAASRWNSKNASEHNDSAKWYSRNRFGSGGYIECRVEIKGENDSQENTRSEGDMQVECSSTMPQWN
jgi:hypothetical protein